MTLEELAYLAEIVGLFLFVASLIYVGRQLKQNTDMMKAESRNSIQQNHQQEILALVQHPEIWKGFTGRELEDHEIKLNNWLTASLRSREYEWVQFNNGALDAISWEAFSKAIPLVLSGERAKLWWEASKPIYNTEFVALVDELLSKHNLDSVHTEQTDAASTSGS